MKTLVVGVGNPTRCDDGAGPVVAERIAALDLPDVEVRTTQQLQIELAEEFAQFDRVIVVDAAIGGDAVQFRAIRPDPARERCPGSGVSAERRQPPQEKLAALCRDAATPRSRALQPLREDAEGVTETSASHHLSPAVVLALSGKLHGRAPELLLCTVRGERFDFGTSLSPAVESRVEEAVRRIAGLLRGSKLDETC